MHQASVVACVNRTGRGGRSHKEVRSFGTMRDNLVALCEWLLAAVVTQVAMESTGVYWKPVYAALEDHFEVIVANAQHIKTVPGRKPALGLSCPFSRVRGRKIPPGSSSSG